MYINPFIASIALVFYLCERACIFHFFSDKNQFIDWNENPPAAYILSLSLSLSSHIENHIGHKNFIMMSVLRKSIAYIFIGVWYVLFSIKSIDGRVAGKVGGGAGNYHSGKLSFQFKHFNSKHWKTFNFDEYSGSEFIDVHINYQPNRKFNLKMRTNPNFCMCERTKCIVLAQYILFTQNPH